MINLYPRIDSWTWQMGQVYVNPALGSSHRAKSLAFTFTCGLYHFSHIPFQVSGDSPLCG